MITEFSIFQHYNYIFYERMITKRTLMSKCKQFSLAHDMLSSSKCIYHLFIFHYRKGIKLSGKIIGFWPTYHHSGNKERMCDHKLEFQKWANRFPKYFISDTEKYFISENPSRSAEVHGIHLNQLNAKYCEC